MHTFARTLQSLALFVILPVAMIAQLAERISAGRMLQFLVFGICIFSIGYLLQAYTGAKK